MWAAYEALLAGLPLVSTPSIGGRDRYFDSTTVRIVRPTPEAVKEGVNYWLQNTPDPSFIRTQTLKKINTDRALSVQIFKNLISHHGVKYTDSAIYDCLFRDGPARTPII